MILATFVATRLVLVLVAAITETALPIPITLPTYSSTPILASLTGTDSIYLLGIAAQGYHAVPIHDSYMDWAFFPLFPIATRVMSLLTFGNIALAGVLVANLATLAAAFVMYRLGESRLGHRGAVLAVVYLLISPGAVAFGMAYTDSLFLLLALGAFAAAERGRWLAMGVLYGLATLTRMPGLLLAIPLLLVVLNSERGRWRAAAPLVLGPIALLAFTVYLWDRFGVAFAYLNAQAAWNNPAKTVVSGTLPAGAGPLVAILIGTLLVYTFLFVYARVDRLSKPDIALMVVSVLTIIASGRLLSVGRYLAVVWPFSWVLARRGGWMPLLWPAVSGSLFTLHAVLNFTQTLAP